MSIKKVFNRIGIAAAGLFFLIFVIGIIAGKESDGDRLIVFAAALIYGILIWLVISFLGWIIQNIVDFKKSRKIHK